MRRLAAAAAAAVAALVLAAAPAVASADEIAEWCEVDPDVLRVGDHTFQVRYEVQRGDQRRVHELVAFVDPAGRIRVDAPADLAFRFTVRQVN